MPKGSTTLAQRMVRTVSLSEIKSYRQCTLHHHYRYALGLSPRKKNIHIELGSIIHDLREAWIKTGDWESKLKEIMDSKKNLFLEERPMYEKLFQDSRKIMKGYLRKWRHEPLDYILVEDKMPAVPFVYLNKTRVPGYGKFIGLVVKPDGLARSMDGYLWVVECKTVKRFPEIEIRLFDLQTSLYIWALKKAGFGEIAGVLWDEIRSKAPSTPRVLKDGSVSRASKIDTDWYTYRRFLKKNGLDVSYYSDMKAKLRGRDDNFFRRVLIPVKPIVLDRIVRDAQNTAVEIAQEKTPIMELGFHCRTCEFNKICQAKLKNSDVNYVIKTEYTKREKK